MGNTVHMKVT